MGWHESTSPRHSWMHETEPEARVHGPRMTMPRGKRVGGSSSTTGMIYIRGHRLDDADWVADPPAVHPVTRATIDAGCQADLPSVGENLQDHVRVPMTWRLQPGVRSLDQAFRGLGLPRSLCRHLLLRSGPVTSPPAEFGAYLKSDPALPCHDIQVFGLQVTGDPSLRTRASRSLQPDTFGGLTLAPHQLWPFSPGRQRLKDAGAAVHPALHMNDLHAQRDRRALLWGLRLLRDKARQSALAAYRRCARPTCGCVASKACA